MLNYLKEDTRFLEQGMGKGLSPRAHVLWHYLLHFNNAAAIFDTQNQAWWPVWFSVDNKVLVKVLGMRTSSEIYAVRKQLVERQMIRFRRKIDTVSVGGEYALVPFEKGMTQRTLFLPGYPEGVDVWVPEGRIIQPEDAVLDWEMVKQLTGEEKRKAMRVFCGADKWKD